MAKPKKLQDKELRSILFCLICFIAAIQIGLIMQQKITDELTVDVVELRKRVRVLEKSD